MDLKYPFSAYFNQPFLEIKISACNINHIYIFSFVKIKNENLVK